MKKTTIQILFCVLMINTIHAQTVRDAHATTDGVNANLLYKPIGRQSTLAIGSELSNPLPNERIFANPFAEFNSPLITNPKRLSLFIDNRARAGEEYRHQNIGILQQGTFGFNSFQGGGLNKWMSFGLSPREPGIPAGSNIPRSFIPDEWGLKFVDDFAALNLGIRNLGQCSTGRKRSVLSWSSDFSGELNNFDNNYPFYIDYYENAQQGNNTKRNILKFTRFGNVGIGLRTYSTIPGNENWPCAEGAFDDDITYNPFNELFPQSKLDVAGNVSIGEGYAGNNAAPVNGLLVQGNVGIGTANPASRLHVVGGTFMLENDIQAGLNSNDARWLYHHRAWGTSGTGPYGDILFLTHDDASGNFFNNGQNALSLARTGRGNGFLGVNMIAGTTGGTPIALDVNGIARCTNGVWVSSDFRYKENITPINNAISKILKLNCVTYNLKSNFSLSAQGKELPTFNLNTMKGKQIGLIAQEVEAVVPEAVITDSFGYKAVNYAQLVALLTEGIKEQQSQIEMLSAKLNEMNSRNGSQQGSQTVSDSFILAQNNPNPFSNVTQITYSAPASYGNLYILITRLDGVTLKRINLSSNSGQVSVSSEGLQDGIYNYSLISEGRELKSRRMIISRN